MIYRLLVRRALSSRIIWQAALNEPFMAFAAGQLIVQPGGAPFKIESVWHTFDKSESGEAVHCVTLLVSGEE